METLATFNVGDHFTFPNEPIVYSVRELRGERLLCASELEGFVIKPLHVFAASEQVIRHANSHFVPFR